MALHPGIVRPWHQRLAEAEDAYLDLLRAADPEAERTAQRFLESAGLDPMTEDLPVGAVAAAFMVAGQTPRRSSDQ